MSTHRRGSRGGGKANTPPSPLTATTSSPNARQELGSSLLRLMRSIKRILITVCALALLIFAMVSSSGFVWGLSVSFGIPLLFAGLYFGWPLIRKLIGANKSIVWWIMIIMLGVGIYYWWKPSPYTPTSTWWPGATGDFNITGIPNYWRNPKTGHDIHRNHPDVRACESGNNLANVLEGAQSSGPVYQGNLFGDDGKPTGISGILCSKGPDGNTVILATEEVQTAFQRLLQEQANNAEIERQQQALAGQVCVPKSGWTCGIAPSRGGNKYLEVFVPEGKCIRWQGADPFGHAFDADVDLGKPADTSDHNWKLYSSDLTDFKAVRFMSIDQRVATVYYRTYAKNGSC